MVPLYFKHKPCRAVDSFSINPKPQVNIIYQLHTVYDTSRMQAEALQESFIEQVGQYVQTLMTVSAGMGQTPLAFENTRACV